MTKRPCRVPLFAFIFASVAACAHAPTYNVAPPASVTFGNSLEAMTPVFESSCATFNVRVLDPAALPIAKTSHVQVDCQGLFHAGSDRLAEFVFADDSLAFVWVLTTAEEEPTILDALLETYGEPTHNTPLFVAFTDAFVALRRDTPELLYYGEAVAPVYRSWFDQSADE